MTFTRRAALLALIMLSACTPQQLQEANTVYQDVDGTLKTACLVGATGQALVTPVDPALAANSRVAAANAACAAINATPTTLTPGQVPAMVTPLATPAPSNSGGAAS